MFARCIKLLFNTGNLQSWICLGRTRGLLPIWYCFHTTGLHLRSIIFSIYNLSRKVKLVVRKDAFLRLPISIQYFNAKSPASQQMKGSSLPEYFHRTFVWGFLTTLLLVDTIDTGFSLVDFNETWKDLPIAIQAGANLCIEAIEMNILICLVHWGNGNEHIDMSGA